jgi:hypothetical protein
MFPYTEVVNKLQNTNWSGASKQSLISVAPRLGKWALSFLNQQTGTIGSEYNSDIIAAIVSAEPQWYSDIQQGNDQHIIDEVKTIISFDDELKHKALLAVVLDIRYNKPLAAKLSPELSNQFDILEVQYFRNLPFGEVANMLNARIFNLITQKDAQMEIKRYCYYRDSLSREDDEIVAFKAALDNSTLQLGSEPLTVKEWISDFLESSATSADHGVYDVARYIVNSPKAKKLEAKEKEALSEILKLYGWLLKPYTTEEEIDSYENPNQPKAAAPFKPAIREHVSAEPIPTAKEKRKYPLLAHDSLKISSQAEIHELVNNQPKTKMGVIKDPTNIKVHEEKQRIDEERNSQEMIIQKKLAELRKRNNNPQ